MRVQADEDAPNGLTSTHVQDPTSSLPPPPRPSADLGTVPIIATEHTEHETDHEVDNVQYSQLTPLLALKLLCLAIESLVSVTGDIPPTPPITSPRIPTQARATPEEPPTSPLKPVQDRPPTPRISCASPQSVQDQDHGQDHHDADAIPRRARTPIGSPEAHPTEPNHMIDPSSTVPPETPISPAAQHGAIARKFYSKKPPPISFHEYLLRLHRYCPMSTAVYLATSIYIHRLALGSPQTPYKIPVAPRNAHRLLLAGLRVAMKALEDQSYPARRFAKVGGVSEAELKRLEIAFCYVSNFDLRVTEEMLEGHVEQLRRGMLLAKGGTTLKPELPVMNKQKKMSLRSGQNQRAEVDAIAR